MAQFGWPAVLLWILSISGCGLINPHNISNLERNMFQLVNDHLQSAGLQELAWRDAIAAECRRHSENMASGAVSFSHDGFRERTAAIAKTIPCSRIAENIGYVTDIWGFSSPARVIFEKWLEKPAHRENIEGGYELTGVGVGRSGSTYYFTQIYLRR